MKYLILFLLLTGCSTAYVQTDCLKDIESDRQRLKGEHENKTLTDSEYAHALNDEISLVGAMELSNRIFKISGMNYCGADFNDERWTLQQEINFLESLTKK